MYLQKETITGLHYKNFTYFLHLCPNIQSVFSVLRNLDVELRNRTVRGFFFLHICGAYLCDLNNILFRKGGELG